MGMYSLEEITLDEDTGRKTGRRKVEAKPAAEDEDHEEEKGAGNTKIRDKY